MPKVVKVNIRSNHKLNDYEIIAFPRRVFYLHEISAWYMDLAACGGRRKIELRLYLLSSQHPGNKILKYFSEFL